MKLIEAIGDDPDIHFPWKKGDFVVYEIKPGKAEFDYGKIIHIANKRGLDFYRAHSSKRADGEMKEGFMDRFKRKKKYQGIEVIIKSVKTGKPVFIDASQIVSKVEKDLYGKFEKQKVSKLRYA